MPLTSELLLLALEAFSVLLNIVVDFSVVCVSGNITSSLMSLVALWCTPGEIQELVYCTICRN